MGIPATTDFTATNNDGGAGKESSTTPIILSDGWVIFKGEDSFYLVYQTEQEGTGATILAISPPLFRFNKYGPRNIGQPVDFHIAQAWDCDGAFYVMTADSCFPAGDTQWAYDFWNNFWNNFWNKAGIVTTAEIQTDSFYIPEIGKDFQTPRKLIPKTKTVVNPNHRHYNLSHLRIKAGMDMTKLGEEKVGVIDDLIGAKKNSETGVITEQVWSHGGVTLAFGILTFEPGSNRTYIEFGMSVCSVRDFYNRKIGADIAVKRLESYSDSNEPWMFGLIREDISGTYHFQGRGRIDVALNPQALRPTTVDASTPYYELEYKYRMGNLLLQSYVLGKVLEEIAVQVPDGLLGRVSEVISAARATILWDLRNEGPNLPHIFIQGDVKEYALNHRSLESYKASPGKVEASDLPEQEEFKPVETWREAPQEVFLATPIVEETVPTTPPEEPYMTWAGTGTNDARVAAQAG